MIAGDKSGGEGAALDPWTPSSDDDEADIIVCGVNGLSRNVAELRGFKPLTSTAQAPVRGDGAAASRANTAEGAPLDPTLDRRCFP